MCGGERERIEAQMQGRQRVGMGRDSVSVAGLGGGHRVCRLGEREGGCCWVVWVCPQVKCEVVVYVDILGDRSPLS